MVRLCRRLLVIFGRGGSVVGVDAERARSSGGVSLTDLLLVREACCHRKGGELRSRRREPRRVKRGESRWWLAAARLYRARLPLPKIQAGFARWSSAWIRAVPPAVSGVSTGGVVAWIAARGEW